MTSQRGNSDGDVRRTTEPAPARISIGMFAALWLAYELGWRAGARHGRALGRLMAVIDFLSARAR